MMIAERDKIIADARRRPLDSSSQQRSYIEFDIRLRTLSLSL
jgi:hypothetical protein